MSLFVENVMLEIRKMLQTVEGVVALDYDQRERKEQVKSNINYKIFSLISFVSINEQPHYY